MLSQTNYLPFILLGLVFVPFSYGQYLNQKSPANFNDIAHHRLSGINVNGEGPTEETCTVKEEQLGKDSMKKATKFTLTLTLGGLVFIVAVGCIICVFYYKNCYCHSESKQQVVTLTMPNLPENTTVITICQGNYHDHLSPPAYEESRSFPKMQPEYEEQPPSYDMVAS